MPHIVGLIRENMQLGEEVRNMKKQMDRERQDFHVEIRRLESAADELQVQLERSVEEHRTVVDDYCQKIDALEKQLRSEKQFIEVCCVLVFHYSFDTVILMFFSVF